MALAYIALKGIMKAPERFLAFFAVLTAIGEIGNIWIWLTPEEGGASQASLRYGPISSSLGFDFALWFGCAILAFAAVVYCIASVGLLKKQKWGAKLIIGVSLLNRLLSLVIFQFNAGAFAIIGCWSLVLIVMAYFSLPKLSLIPQNSSSIILSNANNLIEPSQPVALAQQQKFCGYCRNEIRKNARFCNKCGKPVS
jgi:hypothetical protein